jgi:hypothetical protein
MVSRLIIKKEEEEKQRWNKSYFHVVFPFFILSILSNSTHNPTPTTRYAFVPSKLSGTHLKRRKKK